MIYGFSKYEVSNFLNLLPLTPVLPLIFIFFFMAFFLSVTKNDITFENQI